MLRTDDGGVVRVGKSRVSLDLVVEQYEDGLTPEDMVRAYDTLVLPDVYATIAYYLRYRDEVRVYLKRRAEEAAALQAKIEAERRALRGMSCSAQGCQREGPCSDWSVTPMSTAASSAGCAAAGRTSILLRAQDALPEGTPDAEILAWAAGENCVLLTNDRNTMIGSAYMRAATGQLVPGVIATTREQSIGSAIDDILLIAEYMPEEEIADQVVVFLPFRG